MTTEKKLAKALKGLSLKSVAPANVVNNQFVPVESPAPTKQPALKTTAVSRSSAKPATKPVTTPAPVTATPGGKAFIATTQALGKKGVAIQLAQMDDGSTRSTFEIQKDGFTLDLLFKDFSSVNNKYFVFDDVKVILKREKKTSSLIFSGVLRMNSAVLKPLQDFVQQDEGLLVGGSVDVTDQDLSQKLKPAKVILTSAVSFHLAVSEDVVFSDLKLNVAITPDKSAAKNAKKWNITPSFEGNVTLGNLAHSSVELGCRINYTNKTLKVSAQTEKADGLFGIASLSLNNLKAEFTVGQEKSIQLQASLDAAKKSYEFGGAITQQYSGLYTSVSKFSLTELEALFRQITSLKLALPEFNVTFSNVYLGMATADCKIEKQALKEGVTVGAKLTVHGRQCQALAHISSSGVSFTGSLGELKIGPVTIKKARLEMQFFTKASGRASEFAIAGQAVIEGVQVDCKLAYEKSTEGWTAILYAALQANSFGMASIIPAAKNTFVDSLKFSKVAFVYASKDSSTKDPDFAFEVRKGLQLVGILEEIPALSDLTGNKQVGLELSAYYGKTTDIGIRMPDTRLNLGNSVTCNPFQIRIVILPKPSLDLIFSLDATVPKQSDPLHFDAKLSVGIEGASGSGTMKNYWINPFGVNGLKIGPALALELGILYPQFLSTGTPSSFGFAGGLALGDVTANMAVKISEDPTEEILYGELEELSPANLVSFAKQVSNLKLPANAVPNFFELQELKIYCAPAGGSIGTITFEPGFSFACDLVLFGKRASAYTRISDDGVVAKGHLDKLEIGPLKVSGEQGKNAELDLELTMAKQSILIDGEIEFLGSSSGIYVNISNQGIDFHFDQSFVGLLTYQIDGLSKGTIAKPASLDFLLSGEFDNQLTAYLKNDLAQKIHAAIHVVETDINKAKKDVEKAEQVYKAEFDKAKKSLDKAQVDASRYLKQCQQAVTLEKKKFTQSLDKAKVDVANAKKIYDKAFNDAEKVISKAQGDYDNGMRSAQNAVSKAQRDYDTAMKKAQSDVSKAQAAYSNAMGGAAKKVRAARNKVGSLKRDRDRAVKELKHLSWKKAYKAPYLSAKIAGLETAMRTAQGVLYAAEGVIRALQKGVEYTAFEGAKATLEALRYGGKYGALEAAKKTLEATRVGGRYGVLEAAKKTVSAVKHGSDYTAWQAATQSLNAVQTTGRFALDGAEHAVATVGQSSTYIALEAAEHSLEIVKQGTSAVAFGTAKATLEGAKQGSKAMLSVAEFVATHAGDLIDVKHVKLSAQLKAIERGELFKADVDVAVLSKPYHWKVDFDVREPLKFVEKLLANALTEARKIVA